MPKGNDFQVGNAVLRGAPNSTDPDDALIQGLVTSLNVHNFEQTEAYYQFARSLMRNQDTVLDVSKNIGMGVHLLAGTAARVVGMCADRKVLEDACQRWIKSNIQFHSGSPLDPSTYPGEKFNFIIAYGVLEYLSEGSLFLAILKDHLSENGVLCISAPLDTTSNGGNATLINAYVPSKMQKLLRHYFTNVAMFHLSGTDVPGSGATGNLAVAYDHWPRRFTIAYVSQEYPAPPSRGAKFPNSGGIGTYTQIAARGLAKQGHQVYVISKGMADSETQQYNDDNVTVRRLPNNMRGSSRIRRHFGIIGETLLRMLTVRSEICAYDSPSFDLIETSDWGAETLFSHTSKTSGSVWITRLHTPSFVIRECNQARTTFGTVIIDWFEKLNAHLADEVTAPSRAIADICQKAWRLNPIVTLPNPMTEPKVPTSQDKSKAKTVGYLAGRFDTLKGFPTVARSLQELLPEYPNQFRFILLGSDQVYVDTKELLLPIEQWIDDGSGTRPITLLPRKTRDELQEILEETDVVIVASLFENAPYVVLEAMASGKLIVATRVGGLPEIVEEGKTGFLFEPDVPASLTQCLKYIMSLDPAEISQIRTNAQQVSRQRYSLENLVPTFEVYYAFLVGQKMRGIQRRHRTAWWLPPWHSRPAALR